MVKDGRYTDTRELNEGFGRRMIDTSGGLYTGCIRILGKLVVVLLLVPYGVHALLDLDAQLFVLMNAVGILKHGLVDVGGLVVVADAFSVQGFVVRLVQFVVTAFE